MPGGSDSDSANARLIAAAPTLLEALKRIQGALEMIAAAFKPGSPTADVLTETAATANAAIAAAEEEEQQ